MKITTLVLLIVAVIIAQAQVDTKRKSMRKKERSSSHQKRKEAVLLFEPDDILRDVPVLPTVSPILERPPLPQEVTTTMKKNNGADHNISEFLSEMDTYAEQVQMMVEPSQEDYIMNNADYHMRLFEGISTDVGAKPTMEPSKIPTT